MMLSLKCAYLPLLKARRLYAHRGYFNRFMLGQCHTSVYGTAQDMQQSSIQ